MEKADKRILVVDDEQDLCEILSFNIQIEGQFCRRGFGKGYCSL